MSKTPISKEQEQFLLNVKREKRNVLLTQIGVFLLGMLIWEISARLKLIDTFLTSSPSAILKLIIEYTLRGRLSHHISVSVMETIAGFTIGTILGVLIAIGLWWSGFGSRVLDPYLVVLNSLPKTALAPIIIIWVGAGYSGIIVTAISISIVVTIMNMHSSFRSVEEDKVKLLDTFGATKLQILNKLILPFSIPDLISTFKINIGLSWVGVIVGEFLVSKAGIGYLIVYGSQVFRLDIVMMGVTILAIISALMYKIIALAEVKFNTWVK